MMGWYVRARPKPHPIRSKTIDYCQSGLISVGSWTRRAGGLGSNHAAISRPHADDPRPWSGAAGPDRHRHLVLVRRPDALRPGGWLPAADHQEASLALDHRRAAVVPSWRHQH